MDSLDNLYQNEIYLGDYKIEWSDQKIVITCSCIHKEEIEIYSDSYTYCEHCGRRYSILELIKVESTTEKEDNDAII